MKNKLFSFRILSILLATLLLATALCVPVFATTEQANAILDRIQTAKQTAAGATSPQEWIDTALTENAGVLSEWYILALSQSGTYDFSSYESALLQYLAEKKVNSASSRQKYALALIATGSTASYIEEVLENSFGQQGIMSWVYGLHLLHNGYLSFEHTPSSILQEILALQLEDGGWVLNGTVADVDVTAMTVQALAPHYDSEPTVRDSVDRALALLSSRQQANGDFASYGVNNPESAAQVLLALSELGIDGTKDSRFIQNGNTILDAIARYQLPSGEFCHQAGGPANENATSQIFYALTAYLRMKNDGNRFYLFDQRNQAGLTAPDTPTFSEVSSAPTSSTSQPSSSGTTSAPNTTPSTSNALLHGYKLWLCLGILLLTLLLCAILRFGKKSDPRNLLLLLAGGAALILLVLFTNFQSVDDHYQNAGSEKENAIGSVTITIRCDTVADSGEEYIPADGVILPLTTYSIAAGDTVFTILSEATAQHRIPLETNGSGTSVYVEGLSNLYEFQFGNFSGWVYRHNGEVLSQSCGETLLADGDTIEWFYSLEMGKEAE